MKVAVAEYERVVKDTELRMVREKSDSETTAAELAEARSKLGSLGERTTDLERQLLLQTTETEVMHKRVQELESKLGDQGKALAERDYQIDRLRNEAEAARQTEADLRNEIASTSGRSSIASDKVRSDIKQLEAQLAVALEERAKLQRELATMKRDAEQSWAAERVENALLRERINDVAAEVARLTATLEGPGSTIVSMLAVDAPVLGQGSGAAASHAANDGNGPRNEDAESAPDNKTTLADRIRALQSTASRVASSN
jgi:chromosome segregation ATPase